MKVAVVGAGTMGAGISQACAVAGHQVAMFDLSDQALERGRAAVADSLERLVRKEKTTRQEADAALDRIEPTLDLERCSGAEIIIEAVFEEIEVKRRAWQQVSEVAAPAALLTTNTSSLSVTEIAAASGRPEQFCGLHFFNPVALMPLVEVVRAQLSDDATIARACEFVEGVGKTPIVCEDRPGFIVNRLLIPYMNDAVHALGEGVASAADIDRAMKLGANMPIGPLALADLVGLDVALAAADTLHREFGDPKFRVAPLLRQLVRAGKLGRKSGAGFFEYE